MKKTIETKRNGFRLVWQGGEKGMIDVNVYIDPNPAPIIEWSYPKVVGNSIMGNASFWEEQACLEAKSELRKA